MVGIQNYSTTPHHRHFCGANSSHSLSFFQNNITFVNPHHHITTTTIIIIVVVDDIEENRRRYRPGQGDRPPTQLYRKESEIANVVGPISVSLAWVHLATYKTSRRHVTTTNERPRPRSTSSTTDRNVTFPAHPLPIF